MEEDRLGQGVAAHHKLIERGGPFDGRRVVQRLQPAAAGNVRLGSDSHPSGGRRVIAVGERSSLGVVLALGIRCLGLKQLEDGA